MKYKELKRVAEFYSLQDEEVDDIEKFLSLDNLSKKVGRNMLMCGHCIKRCSDLCPWPSDSKIYEQPCCDFEAKEVLKKNEQ